jgi:nucleotide-binding universal stress UspA family protein
MGQKGEHAEWVGELMGSNVERVVRHASTPCLVTPPRFKPLTKILAAYDGSGHASQALQEATELAKALDIGLVILTATEGMDAEKAQQVSRDGISLVRAHDCAAANMVVEGEAGPAILETAHQQACDLIVVGAYGHSRVREMILGSTTAHLISKSDMPVMLVR